MAEGSCGLRVGLRAVVAVVVVLACVWAAEVRLEFVSVLLDPMPRVAGRPDMTGLWAGPPGALMDVDTVDRPVGGPLAEALRVRGLTLTGFGGRLTGVVLRRGAGGVLRHPAVARERVRDRRRWLRGEADSWLDRNPWERCISRGLPPAALPAAQADRWLIVQTPGVVAVVAETLHELRVFYPSRSAPAVGPPGGWLGVSTARWTRGRLEVVTTGVAGERERGGVPPADPIPGVHPGPSAGLRLVETWRPRHRGRIDYLMRVDDPDTYRSPAVYGFTLRREPSGAAVHEYACHEGNRSLPLTLRGARADEAGAVFGSRVGVAERAWFGRPGSAGPRRAFDGSRVLPLVGSWLRAARDGSDDGVDADLDAFAELVVPPVECETGCQSQP